MDTNRPAALMSFLPSKQNLSARQMQAQERPYKTGADFMGNSFVSVTVSSQACGLSIVVNLNPASSSNSDEPSYESKAPVAPKEEPFPVEEMSKELRQTLEMVQQGQLRNHPNFQSLPNELLRLKHVTLIGDEDPTLIPNFAEAIQSVVWLRALGTYFKIVLVTRGTCLHYPDILQGIDFLTKSDEIWITLDGCPRSPAAKSEYVDPPLDRILSNILLVGRKRPVVIQSAFPLVKSQDQPLTEIHKYVMRLNELKDGGAQISHVQIYSSMGPNALVKGNHLSLRVLSQIAQTIRQTTGLRVEVF